MESHTEQERLLAGLLNGTLTHAEQTRLDQLLRDSPQLRQHYLALTELHLDLKQAVPTTPRSGEFPPAPSRVAPRGPGASRSRSRSHHPHFRWRQAAWTCACAAAGLLLLAVCWRNFVPSPDSRQAHLLPPADRGPQPTAAAADLPTIAEAAGVKIFSWGMAPAVGQPLELGEEIVLTRGMLAIEFAQGARVVLTAPSVFTPLSRDSMLVTSGQISVHAPPGAEGFQVHTPSAEVVDLGTRFAVAVDAVGDTRVNVVEGAAALSARHADTAQPLLLREGQTAAVDRGRPPATTADETSPVPYVADLPDRVVSYTATQDAEGLADEFLTLSVQRGGQLITYSRDELTRGQLVGFASHPGVAVFCTRRGAPIPQGAQRLELLTDWSLVTGIINPRSAPSKKQPAAVGIELEFNPPLINGPGPDAVLFDLQLLVGAETGDTLNVSTDRSRAADQMIEIRQFDIDLTSPAALDLTPYQVGEVAPALNSVDDLLQVPVRARNPNFIRSKALATGIDLSELGYAAGESVSRLMLHDWHNDGQGVDPVLVVGLPQ